MNISEPKRRLAALMMADVVGYSRLVGEDEAGTVARLRALRQDVLEPAIAIKGGRLVKTMGDGFLVEFSSVVEATACAIEIQQRCAAATASVAIGDPLRLRIGVHVGDVLLEGDDLLGDGVNVVARLEGVAESGSICLSADAYRHVEGKLPHHFEDAGEHNLKNIARPMRVFRWRGDVPSFSTMSAALPLPDKPSIAVLPFTNMSGDPEQEYFVDGMVEDIITALSRIRWMFVIARNSSFTYKGKAVDIKQVGRELGVRYVLEGSVRKAGNRLRITGQLIEAATGAHVWADRYDGLLEDVFDLQDRVTENVVGVLEPRLRGAEIERAKRKLPENLTAYDYYLRALARYFVWTKDDIEETLALLDKSIEADPDYAAPYALAAHCLTYTVTQGWAADPQHAAAESARKARKAVELDRDDPTVLSMAGQSISFAARDWGTGIALLDRAIALNPNSAQAYCFSGWVRSNAGLYGEALEHLHRALRLSPIDQHIFLVYSGLAINYLHLGQLEKTVEWAEKSIQSQASFSPGHRFLAAGLAHLGQLDEARAAMKIHMEINPGYRVGFHRQYGGSKSEGIDLLIEGVRLAGAPE